MKVTGKSSIDGIERQARYRLPGGFPPYVAVGLPHWGFVAASGLISNRPRFSLTRRVGYYGQA
jgi:hypothetical protein